MAEFVVVAGDLRELVMFLMEKYDLDIHQPDIVACLWFNFRNESIQWERAERAASIAEDYPRRKLVKWTERDLRAAVVVVRQQIAADELAVLQTRVKFSGKSSVKLVEQVLQASTGRVDPIEVGILAHWLHSIKRKIFNLGVKDHIMPILFSPEQGSGKTTLVHKIVEPLRPYVIDASMTDVVDPRYQKTFSKKYVAVLDELAGVAKAESASLKRLISALALDYRPMGENDTASIQQRCSFVGTTNLPFNEQIKDSTGARRFYQLRCIGVMDWSSINSIDYVELWRALDESQDSGIFLTPDVRAALRTRQELLRVADVMTTFLEEVGALPPNEDRKEVKASDFYDRYRLWCESTGHMPNAATTFGRAVVNRGIEKGFASREGKPTRFYLVNQSTDVGGRSLGALINLPKMKGEAH